MKKTTTKKNNPCARASEAKTCFRFGILSFSKGAAWVNAVLLHKPSPAHCISCLKGHENSMTSQFFITHRWRQGWEGVKCRKTHFISIISDFLHLFYWSAERMQSWNTPEHWHSQSTWANWDRMEEQIQPPKFDVLMPKATIGTYRQTGAEFLTLSYSKYDHKNSHHI